MGMKEVLLEFFRKFDGVGIAAADFQKFNSSLNKKFLALPAAWSEAAAAWSEACWKLMLEIPDNISSLITSGLWD